MARVRLVPVPFAPFPLRGRTRLLLVALVEFALLAGPVPTLGGWTAEITTFEAAGLVSPQDPPYALVDELYRTAHRAGAPHPILPAPVGGLGWATLGHVDPAAAGPRTGHPAETLLAGWTRSTGLSPALGLSLRPELTLVALGTDPPRQLRPPYRDVRQGDAVDPALRALLGFRADARLLRSLSAHFRFRFDSDGRNNPLNRTPDFDPLGTSNDVDEAYLRWQTDPVAVLLGRAPLAWGPDRGGPLALSATAPALDLVHASLRWGAHRLQVFAGQLSRESVAPADSGAVASSYKRYLYGHRVDLFFGRWRLGVDELALVAGPNESLSLRYLNPIQFYAQAQTERDGEAASQVNVLLSVDSDLFVQRFHLYGSLVVDDLQIDREGREQKPDQLAGSIGVDWTPAADSPWWLGYAYRRVGTWTYLHSGEATSYRHFSRPLGAPEGPDTDRHLLRLARRLARRWRIALSAERWRRGENRITTSPAERAGHAGEPFPSGRVERRWIATMGVEVTLPPHAWAAVTGSYHAVDQVNNTERDEDIFEVRLEIGLRAPALGWTVAALPGRER